MTDSIYSLEYFTSPKRKEALNFAAKEVIQNISHRIAISEFPFYAQLALYAEDYRIIFVDTPKETEQLEVVDIINNHDNRVMEFRYSYESGFEMTRWAPLNQYSRTFTSYVFTFIKTTAKLLEPLFVAKERYEEAELCLKIQTTL